jgi:hypothetical protein
VAGALDAAPDPAAARQADQNAQPVGRMGTRREVGLLCLYLAADATFTTGVDRVVRAALVREEDAVRPLLTADE